MTRLITTSIISIALLMSCGKNNSESNLEIVGGKKVTKNQQFQKHVVALISASGHNFCTGSLVGKQLVLTAAHCVKEAPKFYIGFGTAATLKKLGRKNLRKVQAIRMHREYVDKMGTPVEQEARAKKGIFISDIALIKISSPAPTGFEPIKLLPSTWDLKPHKKLILTGYGVTGTPKRGADMSAPNAYFNPKNILNDNGTLRATSSYYSGRTNQGEIIAYTPGDRRGVCSGDSGGPLIVPTRSPKSGRIVFYQLGVAARSTCHKTGIYTDTRAHYEWIKKARRSVALSANK